MTGVAIQDRTFFALTLLLVILIPARLPAQEPPGDPVALVRAASWNELHASSSGHPFRFRLRKQDENGATTKDIIETKDGDVARLVAVNDQPLTPDRVKAERARLDNLLAHPELQARRHKREQEDGSRSNEMIRLLPDAFLYTYRGIVNTANGPAYRLSFEPNQRFIPPDREAQVYHGMAGELWINCAEKRMARLDAHLISDVDFGWGIVGRLFKGGTILVEQQDVGNGHWESTHLKLNLTGKILMLKSLVIRSTEDGSEYKPVSNNVTYKEAIQMLESE
ncbi:MAG: hypothetical protein JWM54_1377 [Acidobacteriaceae bacterium]|nr:hypothetical protein [Acidobacteriaceae bacterium]